MVRAWEPGVQFCRDVVKAGVPAPCDIVVTSCAGYPLDTTWYQAVKGLTGRLPIVRKGGTIVLAASMTEGLGSPEFQERLADYEANGRYDVPSPSDACEMDEWQLVMFKKVVAHCKVKVVTHGLPADRLRRCRVEPAASLAEYGPDAKIAVISKGPYVQPFVIGR